MPTRPELIVLPLEHYPEPEYPSWEDPDPTVHPYPIAYPFGERLIKALAAAGLAASFGSANSEEATSGNPLSVANSGLPFATSAFGTGQPTRLEEGLARRTIHQIFKKEGYAMKSPYTYQKNGISFEADGYDPDKKVGFIFTGWKNLDIDGIRRWWVQQEKTDPETLLGAVLKRSREPDAPALKKAFAEAQKIQDKADRAEAMEKVLEQYSTPRVSLEELRKLEQQPEVDKDFIAVISQFDRRFVYYGWSKEYISQRKKAQAIADPAKRKAALLSIQKLMAKEALEKLEGAVREYIAWARTQGAR